MHLNADVSNAIHSLDDSTKIEIRMNDEGRVYLNVQRETCGDCLTVHLHGVTAYRTKHVEHVNAHALQCRLDDGATISLSAVADGMIAIEVNGARSTSLVEAKLDLEVLGPCFGLGHLMRQPWPLQDGALELGPFYVSYLMYL